MSYARTQHGGAAVATTLVSDITSGATSATLAASTGWPDGSVGPFWIIIDPNLPNEEHVLVSARSGVTVSGLSRGQDGTSAASHDAGAVIHHGFVGVEADEANQAVAATLGTVSTKGDLLAATGSNAITRLAVGTNGYPLVANSVVSTGLNWAQLTGTGISNGAVDTTQLATNAVTTVKITDANVTTGKLATDAVTTVKITDLNVTGGKLAAGAVTESKIADDAVTNAKIADSAVDTAQLVTSSVTEAKIASGVVSAAKIKAEDWTSYSPTWTGSSTNPTIGNGTVVGAYIQFGKTVMFRVDITTGSTTNLGAGAYGVSLPVAPMNGIRQIVPGTLIDGGGSLTARWAANGITATDASASITRWIINGNTVDPNSPFAWTTGTRFSFTGVYEAD